MLISTIAFEIHDFKNSVSEKFLVENTEDNYAFIASHRFTRNIEFTETFDFQFARERKSPKFLEFGNAIAASFASHTEFEMIDSCDEMVGSF